MRHAVVVMAEEKVSTGCMHERGLIGKSIHSATLGSSSHRGTVQ